MNKPRIITIGKYAFRCPKYIQRCDSDRMHGWQVRYCAFPASATMFFSDGEGGPLKSFADANRELQARLKMIPPKPQTSLRSQPLRHKQNDLPAGISGPVLNHRKSRAPYADLKVSLPRRGRPNAGATCYIGTERTWSAERFNAALAKAIKLREAAVAEYQRSLAIQVKVNTMFAATGARLKQ